jgi:endonuclease/exonuclease/phosphatase family metal-dependent hydrolase
MNAALFRCDGVPMNKKLLALAVATALYVRSDTPPPPIPPIPPPPPPPVGSCESSPSFDAFTWNVGLAPGMVRLSSPRSVPVANALKGLDAAVVCIEEAWLQEDKDRIIAALGFPPENVYVADTVGMGEFSEDACGEGDLDGLNACVKEKCADVGEDTTLCAMAECGTDLLSLYLRNKRCLTCIAAGVGKTVDVIGEACVGGNHASRVYGGQNGLILASRWPLRNREALMLPASGANRPVLMATMDVPGLPPVEVACTHLSAPQRVPPMHTGYEDWEAEQKAQLALASERLAARADGGARPVIFLGDMNFGQEHGPGVIAMSRDAWIMANALGFESPAAFVEPPMCSVCPENNLRDTHDFGQFIDHVLLRNPAKGPRVAVCETSRHFDRPLIVMDAKGDLVTTYLSDHYAIRARLSYH